jgi:hypothetical protein
VAPALELGAVRLFIMLSRAGFGVPARVSEDTLVSASLEETLMEVHITTTTGAAAYTIDLEPEPAASEAIDGVWRNIDQRTPIEVVSRNGRRELVAFNAVHVIDVSVAAA